MNTFGSRFRAARIGLGLTQDDLADRLGITKSAVSAYENNAATPAFDRLPVLSQQLQVSLDELICGRDDGALTNGDARVSEPRGGYEVLNLTKDEARLVQSFRRLSARKQRAAIVMMSRE